MTNPDSPVGLNVFLLFSMLFLWGLWDVSSSWHGGGGGKEEVRTELRGDREHLRTEGDSPQQINVSLTLICETNILRIFRKRWISETSWLSESFRFTLKGQFQKPVIICWIHFILKADLKCFWWLVWAVSDLHTAAHTESCRCCMEVK